AGRGAGSEPAEANRLVAARQGESERLTARHLRARQHDLGKELPLTACIAMPEVSGSDRGA
ncbi:MAG: hypothetical protein WBA60_04330, partial [Methylovirgula sp.]